MGQRSTFRSVSQVPEVGSAAITTEDSAVGRLSFSLEPLEVETGDVGHTFGPPSDDCSNQGYTIFLGLHAFIGGLEQCSLGIYIYTHILLAS